MRRRPAAELWTTIGAAIPGDFLRYELDTPGHSQDTVRDDSLCSGFSISGEDRCEAGWPERRCSSSVHGRMGIHPRAVATGGRFASTMWPAGKHVLELEALAPESNLNTDGFHLSNHPVEGARGQIVLGGPRLGKGNAKSQGAAKSEGNGREATADRVCRPASAGQSGRYGSLSCLARPEW